MSLLNTLRDARKGIARDRTNKRIEEQIASGRYHAWGQSGIYDGADPATMLGVFKAHSEIPRSMSVADYALVDYARAAFAMTREDPVLFGEFVRAFAGSPVAEDLVQAGVRIDVRTLEGMVRSGGDALKFATVMSSNGGYDGNDPDVLLALAENIFKVATGTARYGEWSEARTRRFIDADTYAGRAAATSRGRSVDFLGRLLAAVPYSEDTVVREAIEHNAIDSQAIFGIARWYTESGHKSPVNRDRVLGEAFEVAYGISPQIDYLLFAAWKFWDASGVKSSQSKADAALLNSSVRLFAVYIDKGGNPAEMPLPIYESWEKSTRSKDEPRDEQQADKGSQFVGYEPMNDFRTIGMDFDPGNPPTQDQAYRQYRKAAKVAGLRFQDSGIKADEDAWKRVNGAWDFLREKFFNEDMKWKPDEN